MPENLAMTQTKIKGITQRLYNHCRIKKKLFCFTSEFSAKELEKISVPKNCLLFDEGIHAVSP